MYRIVLVSVLLSFLSSCSSYSYFYGVMDTQTPNVNRDETGRFLVQNDSVDIIYRFYGQNSPITIAVNNRSSSPMYVNWKESGIVLGNTQLKDRKRVQVTAARDEKEGIDFGRFQLDPFALTFVGPHSKVETKILELSNFNFNKIDKNLFTTSYLDKKEKGKEKKYKAIDYTEQNSPVQFNIYLMIYPKSSKNPEPIFAETAFYQSKLIRGEKDNPYQMQEYKNQQSDFFYVKRENRQKAKKAASGTAKTLGVLGLGALWAASEMYEFTHGKSWYE